MITEKKEAKQDDEQEEEEGLPVEGRVTAALLLVRKSPDCERKWTTNRRSE